MKSKITWYIVLFLLGILLAQLLGNSYLAENLLDTYHLENYAKLQIDTDKLFGVILWKRGKLFFFLFLLGLTSFRKVTNKLLPIFFLLAVGFYAGLCLACQGVFGVGIFFLSLFPHWICYGIDLYLMLHRKKPIQYSGKRYILTEIVSVLFMVLLLVAGCLLEATVGNFLLKGYLFAFISAIS